MRIEDKYRTLSQDKLKALLEYNPTTGLFTYRIARKKKYPGDLAGYISPRGYRMINIDYRAYYAARLVWLYVHGCWPKEEMDHINCDRQDDRLANLREATRTQNIVNQRLRRDNVSGVKGVVLVFSRTKKKRWKVYFRHKQLGTFDTKEEATVIYQTAAKECFGEYVRI